MKSLLVCFLLLSTCGHAQYNVESCIEFWKMTSKIRNGSTPGADEWEKLRQTAGYKRKNISTTRWKQFSDKITFVFTPGNEHAASEKAKTDLSYTPILACLKEEDQLKKYVQDMPGSQLMDSALHLARMNLPLANRNCFPDPVIYFVLFDYDGSATNQHVIIGLLISYHTDQCRPGIFAAHEIYHYVTSYCRVKQKRFKRNPAEAHRGAFLAIHAISEEATADLLDKHELIFGNRCPYLFRDTFINYQQHRSHLLIKQISESLEKLAAGKTGAEATTAFWMDMIPWAAHIPGTYISHIIRRNGLGEELIQNASSAFKVFYLYNAAAKIDSIKPPLLSAKAIHFLKRMERRYIK